MNRQTNFGQCNKCYRAIALLGYSSFSGSVYAAAPDLGVGSLIGFAVVIAFCVVAFSISAFIGAVSGQRAFWKSAILMFLVVPALFGAYAYFEESQNNKSFENVLAQLSKACASEREWIYEAKAGVRRVRLQSRPITLTDNMESRRYLLKTALDQLRADLETPDPPFSDWKLIVEDLSQPNAQAISGDSAAQYEFLLSDASTIEPSDQGRYLMRIRVDLVDVMRDKIIATKYEYRTNSSQSCYFSQDDPGRQSNDPLFDPLREQKQYKKHNRDFAFRALRPTSP